MTYFQWVGQILKFALPREIMCNMTIEDVARRAEDLSLGTP